MGLVKWNFYLYKAAMAQGFYYASAALHEIKLEY